MLLDAHIRQQIMNSMGLVALAMRVPQQAVCAAVVSILLHLQAQEASV